jgi:hypothetical protein
MVAGEFSASGCLCWLRSLSLCATSPELWRGATRCPTFSKLPHMRVCCSPDSEQSHGP